MKRYRIKAQYMSEAELIVEVEDGTFTDEVCSDDFDYVERVTYDNFIIF